MHSLGLSCRARSVSLLVVPHRPQPLGNMLDCFIVIIIGIIYLNNTALKTLIVEVICVHLKYNEKYTKIYKGKLNT